MTLDQLLALDAIVATGTFRGAGEKLHKAQSAVSHQIRKLEEEVQFKIFSRDAYRPELTPEGAIFYRETARVLETYRALKTTAQGLKSEQEPIVRITVSGTIPIASILETLAEVGDKFPSTHIRLDTEMMGGPLSRLMSDDAELIIAGLHGVPVDQVETLHVGRITIRPVAHQSFPPANATGLLSRRAMQGYVQVVVSGTGSRDFNQSRDLLSGGQRWNVSDFTTKKAVIMAGLGWGGMPEHLIKDELDRGELVSMNVDGFPTRYTEIFVIRRREKPMGRVTSELWNAFKSLSDDSLNRH